MAPRCWRECALRGGRAAARFCRSPRLSPSPRCCWRARRQGARRRLHCLEKEFTAYACSELDGNECTLTPGSLTDPTVTFSKESVGSAYNLQETHPESVAMAAPSNRSVHHNVDERGLRKWSLRLLKMVENGPQERTRANGRVHLDKTTLYRGAALSTQQEPASAPRVPPTSALFIVAASSALNKFRAGDSKFGFWFLV